MKRLFTLALIIISASTYAQTLQPDENNGVVSVIVTDYKDKIKVGEEISFYGKATKKTFSGITNSQGRFDIKLPKGDIYQILISAIGDQQEYSTMEIPSGKGLYSGELTIQIELPTEITLKDVLFETGSAKLNPSSYKSLDELATFMKRKTTMVIEIAGHTDNVGTEESNLTLSQKRAETVRNYLVAKGVLATRITAKGYGQNKPVADNNSEDGRKQNRRTEVRIIKE